MISRQLLKLAEKYNWHKHTEEDGDITVFGDFNGFLFTAITGKGFNAFFTPVSGISLQALNNLREWLSNNKQTINIRDFELSDNFLCVRLHEGLIARSVSQMESFLIKLTGRLDELSLPDQSCAICGQKAEKKGLYVGLFCYLHPECQNKEGYDFTKEDGEYDKVDFSMQPDEEKLKELANTMKSYKSDLISDVIKICNIESVKQDSDNEAPFGQKTVEALKCYLDIAAAMGFKTVNLDNRAGYVEWGQADEMIAALCHLDVVPAGSGWTNEAFNTQEIENRIVGRGTVDDKGPAIAVLYALKSLKDDDYQPAKRIRLIVGLDEENGSECMDWYKQSQELPIAGFTADASFPVIHAEKGIVWINIKMNCEQDNSDSIRIMKAEGGSVANMVPGSCTITFDKTDKIVAEGRQAHASRPESGTNAISLAILEAKNTLSENNSSNPFINMYTEIFGEETDGSSAGLNLKDKYGVLTLNAGMLKIENNEANLTLDIRYPVTSDLKTVILTLNKLAEKYNFEFKVEKHMEPLFVDKDSHLVKTLNNVYQIMTDTTVEPVAIGGGTYARSIPNIVAFGPCFPGDPDVCHQADESIETDRLLAASAIYKEALKSLSIDI